MNKIQQTILKNPTKNKLGLTDDTYNKIDNVLTINNVKKVKKNVSLSKIILFIIIILISIIISLQDIIVSGGEAVADCTVAPLTLGTLGLATGTVEEVDEIASELFQDILIAIAVIWLSGGSRKSMIIRIAIVGLCSLVDIVLSFIAIFVPCVLDITQTGIEILTEIIQNAVLIYSFFTMF